MTPPLQPLRWSDLGSGFLEPAGLEDRAARSPFVPPLGSGRSKSACRGISRGQMVRTGRSDYAAGDGARGPPVAQVHGAGMKPG